MPETLGAGQRQIYFFLQTSFVATNKKLNEKHKQNNCGHRNLTLFLYVWHILELLDLLPLRHGYPLHFTQILKVYNVVNVKF